MPFGRFAVSWVALLAALGCSEPGPVPAGPPHVVLFTVDTLRADHLSLSGYPRETTPRVDAFAAGAWRFEQAIAVIPKTAPAFATLFTGRHPREHRVTSNFTVLPESMPVVAELLRDHGYRTAAFVGNPALRTSKGFERGFETYRVVPPDRGGLERLREAYLDWSEGAWERPTFVWIHTLDPHGPYEPASDYEALFLDDEWGRSDARVPGGYVRNSATPNKVLGAVPLYQQRDDREDRVAAYVARYDAEIRMMDDLFGAVVDDLRERGLFDASAVIFTSDHGESLGEHDYYFEHGWFAYEATLHVPLLVKPPGEARGRSVRTPVSHLDLVPTLAGLGGIPVPAGAGGIDLLADELPERAILVESSDRYPDKYFGLRTASEKYLQRRGDGREELYDLATDPGETRNLAEVLPERARALRERLARRRSELEARASDAAPASDDDPETLERLRALGYLAAPETAAREK